MAEFVHVSAADAVPDDATENGVVESKEHDGVDMSGKDRYGYYNLEPSPNEPGTHATIAHSSILCIPLNLALSSVEVFVSISHFYLHKLQVLTRVNLLLHTRMMSGTKNGNRWI